MFKAANGDDYEAEFMFLEASKMLIQGRYLGMQLSILEVMLKEKISCFDVILLAVSKFPEPEKKLIQEVQTICKLPAVNPVTGVYWRAFILISVHGVSRRGFHQGHPTTVSPNYFENTF